MALALKFRGVVVGLAALLCALAPLAPVSRAAAHANLVAADPAPNAVLDISPGRVVLKFTEEISPNFSDISVLDTLGDRVDKKDAAVLPNDPVSIAVSLPELPKGSYTVSWRNLSNIDGHAVRGSYAFSIGVPVVAPPALQAPLLQSPAQPYLRWGMLIGAMGFFAAISFRLLVLTPALAGQSSDTARKATGRVVARLGRGFGLLFVAASLGLLLPQAAGAGDVPWYKGFGSVQETLLHTGLGKWWLRRFALFSVTAGLIAAAHLPRLRGRNWVTLLALVSASGMLLTFSLASHAAATTSVRIPGITSDYLHILAAALWGGGLFYFAAVMPTLLKELSEAERRAVLGALVPRFSVLATLSVVTLLVTGVFGAWIQVSTVKATTTPYGLTLLAKVVVIGVLLALGAVNLLWVRRKVETEPSAGRLLRKTVAAEAGLMLLVVLAVGWMTSLEPARETRIREQSSAAKVFETKNAGTSVKLKVDPGKLGQNAITLNVGDRAGKPATDVLDAQVTVSYVGQDLGSTELQAQSVAPGVFETAPALLSIAGTWQVEVFVARTGATDTRGAFRFDIPALGTAVSGPDGPDRALGWKLFGIELAVLGAAFLCIGVPVGGLTNRPGRRLMGAGAGGIFAGLVLLGIAPGSGTPQVAGNPFPPTAESIAIGKGIYTQYCEACHGPAGRGDGPHVIHIVGIPPADLTAHVPLHPMPEIFRFVHDGIPGTDMAPFGGLLSDEQIWHTLNYLKTLVQQAQEGTYVPGSTPTAPPSTPARTP